MSLFPEASVNITAIAVGGEVQTMPQTFSSDVNQYHSSDTHIAILMCITIISLLNPILTAFTGLQI